MCEVSRYLHPFFVNRGICQLTDHVYDMSMFTFRNFLVIVRLNKPPRCIIRHGMPVHAV
jgi:hypothetical protein